MQTMIRTIAVIAILSVQAFGGGFWLTLGNPAASAEAEAMHAVVTVMPTGCHNPAEAKVTAAAEGIVNGKCPRCGTRRLSAVGWRRSRAARRWIICVGGATPWSCPRISPPAALRTVLGAVRERDAITLWHLLSRVSGRDRAEVYRAFARLAPVPAGVTEARIVQADAAALDECWNALGFDTAEWYRSWRREWR